MPSSPRTSTPISISTSTRAQSITDYPLRNQTILALAGLALLLLTRIATDHAAASKGARA